MNVAICATCNRPGYLKESVDFFLRQTTLDARLIIIDDSDRPCDIDHDRVDVIRMTRRTPLAVKWNIGCAAAVGADVCVLWDDDDWYHPGRIAEQAGMIRAGNPAVAYTCVRYYDECEGKMWVHDHPRFTDSTLAFRRSYWQERPFPEGDPFIDEFVRGREPVAYSGFGMVVVRRHDRALPGRLCAYCGSENSAHCERPAYTGPVCLSCGGRWEQANHSAVALDGGPFVRLPEEDLWAPPRE